MPKVQQLTPTNCNVLNNIRSEHSGWTWFNSKGYIEYFPPDYQTGIYEHRLVAERAFNVKLDRTLHVHHKNGDKKDNRVENLQIVTNFEHSQIHYGQNSKVVSCEVCGKTFNRRASQFNRHKHHFCSDKCFKFFSRKAIRPTADELKELIATVNNWCEIGRMFNVCDHTIRDWAKDYGIPVTRRERAKIRA